MRGLAVDQVPADATRLRFREQPGIASTALARPAWMQRPTWKALLPVGVHVKVTLLGEFR